MNCSTLSECRDSPRDKPVVRLWRKPNNFSRGAQNRTGATCSQSTRTTIILHPDKFWPEKYPEYLYAYSNCIEK